MASMALTTSISRLAADAIAEGCSALPLRERVTIAGLAPIAARGTPAPGRCVRVHETNGAEHCTPARRFLHNYGACDE